MNWHETAPGLLYEADGDSGRRYVVAWPRAIRILPERTSSTIFAVCGWQRYMNASINNTLFARAASAMTMASA